MDNDITTFGFDPAKGEDNAALAVRVSDAVFVCDVPKALGGVVRLEQRGGRIVAVTESGMEMIVPTFFSQS